MYPTEVEGERKWDPTQSAGASGSEDFTLANYFSRGNFAHKQVAIKNSAPFFT